MIEFHGRLRTFVTEFHGRLGSFASEFHGRLRTATVAAGPFLAIVLLVVDGKRW